MVTIYDKDEKVVEVSQSHFDDEPCLVPLSEELQKLWAASARRNTPKLPDVTWN